MIGKPSWHLALPRVSQVLLKTIHDAPPELEDKKGTPSFSKYMRDFVGKCLVKVTAPGGAVILC